MRVASRRFLDVQSLPFLFLVALLVLVSVVAGCGDDDDGPTNTGGPPPPPSQVTTGGGSHPTVSPDGSWVAYGNPGGGIARVPSGGGQPETLTTFGAAPDWSSATNLIVFGSSVLFTVDPTTRDTAYIGSEGDGDAAWSPLGDEIAVRVTSGGDGILIMAYPSGTTSRVDCIDADGCDGEGPTWSPDGEWIAFEDGLEILKVQRSGGSAAEVVHRDLDLTEPSWSPDGDWIAFVGGDSTFSNTHIWVADARGEAYGLKQVTSGEVQDRDPTWSPDSRTIYFASNRSGPTQIWKVAFQP